MLRAIDSTIKVVDIPLTPTQEMIEECLKAREKAILIPTSTTKVGALLFDSKGNKYIGYNIQNRTHKSYHAEEMAILNALMHEVDMTKMVGMLVTFSKNSIKELTFCCACCRQVIYEFTKVPNLMIYEVDLNGKIIASKTINELYPYPFPR